MRMNELKEILINHAMNDEEGRLVIGEWSEIEEFGFDPETDAESLITALFYDERVEVWEQEIETEPVLTITYMRV